MSARAVVADTNVVSYIFGARPEAAIYGPILSGREVLVSFQTVAEMRYGAALAGWGERSTAELEQYLTTFKVIHTDDALTRRWASVRAVVMHGGRHLDDADAWIAATALELGVPMVTHNIKDFKHVQGLTFLEPESEG